MLCRAPAALARRSVLSSASRIVKADTDKSGAISVRNLFDFIRQMSMEVKEAAKGGIPIATLNPDTDGDGKVEKWETEVFNRIKDADMDASGSISVKELFGVIKGAAESDKQKKLFQRLLGVAHREGAGGVGARFHRGRAGQRGRRGACGRRVGDPN